MSDFFTSELLIAGNILFILIAILFFTLFRREKNKREDLEEKYTNITRYLTEKTDEIEELRADLVQQLQQVYSINGKHKELVQDQFRQIQQSKLKFEAIQNGMAQLFADAMKMNPIINEQKNKLISLEDNMNKEVGELYTINLMNDEMEIEWLRQGNRWKEIQDFLEDIKLLMNIMNNVKEYINEMSNMLIDDVSEKNSSDLINSTNAMMKHIDDLQQISLVAMEMINSLIKLSNDNQKEVEDLKVRMEEVKNQTLSTIQINKENQVLLKEMIEEQNEFLHLLQSWQKQGKVKEWMQQVVEDLEREHDKVLSIQNDVLDKEELLKEAENVYKSLADNLYSISYKVKEAKDA